ncbi:MAG: hypothetical protein N3F04_04790 [Candidatus Nezhaarchaeota archaeon]|nr:hypothetical protein [Candidatus Nezhaarchaeota archaeon]MCX8142069.1 hypothetical protein [Candidatus Nezhaarchaeota archaeon]MDW8050150.1 hypothetical protein [Nitrososphaerota archaeon]
MVITVNCPECGGDFRYDRHMQRYVCRDCGLTMSRDEFYKSHKEREKVSKEDSVRRDYLKWWLSKKK